MSGLFALEGLRRTFHDSEGRRTGGVGPIDLTIARHELLVVIGRSGSGKSTLLRCIAGLESPDAGVARWATGDPGRIGVVFQEPRLMPWLDVARNVGFSLRGPKAERQARVATLLDLVGLTEAASLLPKRLSGGMAQRAALARGLADAPDLLLLDEPFSALDAPTRLGLQEHLLVLRARLGATMVLVTHDLAEAIRLGDRIVVLDAHGRITALFEGGTAAPDIAVLDLLLSSGASRPERVT